MSKSQQVKFTARKDPKKLAKKTKRHKNKVKYNRKPKYTPDLWR